MFFIRFLITSWFPKTYEYYGKMPYYLTVKPGKVAKVLCGGEFKYYEKYLCTTIGWVKIASQEEDIKKSPAYKKRQEEIRKELQQVKTMNSLPIDNT